MWTNDTAHYLISSETRVAGNHTCGGDSMLEGTSTQLPPQRLEKLLGQDVLRWPNRSDPVVGGHPFRAPCSCWVLHTSAPTTLLRVSYLLWKAGEKSSTERRKLPWVGSSVEKDSGAGLRDRWKPCLSFSRRRVSPARVRVLPGPLGQGSLQHFRLCGTWKWWPCPARVFQQRQITLLTAFFQTWEIMIQSKTHGSNNDFSCTLTWLMWSCVPLHVSGPAGDGWQGRCCYSLPVCSVSLSGSSSISHPGASTSDFVCHAVVLSVGARVCDPLSNKSSIWKGSIHVCSVRYHAS